MLRNGQKLQPTMQMTGSLTECPWNELLTLIERLQLTGWLKIQAQSGQSVSRMKVHQFWFENGELVGAGQASRCDRLSNGLFWQMQRQGWLNSSTATQIAKQCPPDMAVGKYFRQQGVLNSKQLRQLFQMQIMTVLSGLSQEENAQFHLDTEEPLPYERLTGLKLSAYDAIALHRQRKSLAPENKAMMTVEQ